MPPNPALPNTIAEASQVTDATFKYWVEYSAAQDGENDGLFGNLVPIATELSEFDEP